MTLQEIIIYNIEYNNKGIYQYLYKIFIVLINTICQKSKID
jgi:hypothetical protein